MCTDPISSLALTPPSMAAGRRFTCAVTVKADWPRPLSGFTLGGRKRGGGGTIPGCSRTKLWLPRIHVCVCVRVCVYPSS